jgi:hypothetical protein
LALRMCFSPLPKMCLGSGKVFLNIFLMHLPCILEESHFR